MGLVSGDCADGYHNTPKFDLMIEEFERGLNYNERNKI